jgi:hypothetical protein
LHHSTYIPIVPKGKKSEDDRQFNVGDHVRAKLQDGRLVDATIRAVIDQGKVKLQVDFGFDETALILTRQIVD